MPTSSAWCAHNVQHTVLSALTETGRRRLLAQARRRRYAPGEVVFHEGDIGDALQVVTRGHALVRTTTPRGDRFTFSLLAPGDQFGELSLLRADHRHTATVAAVDELETLAIGRPAFDRLCREDPSIGLALAHLLAGGIERLDRQLTEAHFLPAPRRVARRVGQAARTFGGAVPLTQDDLAGLAGTSRSTVNEVLRDLERRGVLRLDRHTITVLDDDALREAGRW